MKDYKRSVSPRPRRRMPPRKLLSEPQRERGGKIKSAFRRLAAKRRKNTAHGVSRGSGDERNQAPSGRKRPPSTHHDAAGKPRPHHNPVAPQNKKGLSAHMKP